MSIFDGVVSFDDQKVAVILAVEPHGIRMSVGTSKIGEWSDGEYTIDDRGDGVFAITAESETLEFVPNDPALFAAGIGGGMVSKTAPTPAAQSSEMEPPESEPSEPIDSSEVPGPRPLTRAVFYVVVAITALLGLWAMVTLFLA